MKVMTKTRKNTAINEIDLFPRELLSFVSSLMPVFRDIYNSRNLQENKAKNTPRVTESLLMFSNPKSPSIKLPSSI